MPSIQTESKKARRLIVDFLRNQRRKQPSHSVAVSLRKRIKAALIYLDQNAINIGDTEASVEQLLGPAPGQSSDTWFYPGGSIDEAYSVQFDAGVVVRKSFEIIYTS